MTENKAIELLKNNYPKCCKMVNGRYKGGFDNTDCELGQAFNIAIKALEEVQQYRAIGTPEECRAAVGNDAKRVIKKHKVVAPEDIEAFGADALLGRCPVCEELVNNVWNEKYCGDCGQKLDWSDEE
nr:MAG TPA: zinc-ribbon containing domain protein [Caudoviricetes sp.]